MTNPSAISAILLLMLYFGCKNQTYQVYENIYPPSSKGGHFGESGPYRITSGKGNFVMESIPFEHSSVIFGDLCSGITNVYQLENDSLIYTIDRYFGVDNTFFSSNGQSIAYVNDYWRGSDYDSCSTNILEFYKAGKLIKEYSYNDLLKTSPGEEPSWLFWDSRINEVLTKNNHYLIDDLLYLIPQKTGTVLIVDINNGEVLREIDTADYLKNLEPVDLALPKVEFLSIEEADDLPDLRNGIAFRDGLQTALNVDLVPYDGIQEENRYYFNIHLECKIHKNGKAFDVRVNSNEKVLVETAEQLKGELLKFVVEQDFEVHSVPYNLEFWKYEDMFYMSRNPQSIAHRDLENYRIEVCQMDSLSGVYIPINLIDAHNELDKILEESAKQKIKNGEPTHFGLGMWLRNNWGLWAGGRLRCYFNQHELYHPDNISSLIITTYRMKLNNDPMNLDSLIQEHAKAEKEWMNN